MYTYNCWKQFILYGNLKRYNQKGYLNAMICQNIVGHWIKRGGSFLEAIKRLGRSTILIIIVMPRKRINNHRDWISHWNIQTFNMSGMNLFIDSRKGYLPSYKRKTVTEAFEPYFWEIILLSKNDKLQLNIFNNSHWYIVWYLPILIWWLDINIWRLLRKAQMSAFNNFSRLELFNESGQLYIADWYFAS